MEASMSEVQPNIVWDSKRQSLSGWILANGERVEVLVSRELVHSISIYNDAIEREIECFKDDIIERLKPILLSK
jgi:hypothetical protein